MFEGVARRATYLQSSIWTLSELSKMPISQSEQLSIAKACTGEKGLTYARKHPSRDFLRVSSVHRGNGAKQHEIDCSPDIYILGSV